MSERMRAERFALFKRDYERCQQDNADGLYDEDKVELFEGLEAEREEVERLRMINSGLVRDYNALLVDAWKPFIPLIDTMAQQKLIDEMGVEQLNSADFESAYDIMVENSRQIAKAIAEAKEG